MPTAPQTTDELHQALQDNDRLPYGRARTLTAEELVEAAERFDEPAVLADALFELHAAYTYGSEPRKSPVVFARLLTLFDEQPDVFDERARHSLFWRFKWVTNALIQLPEMPLATVRQWLTQMRDRYQKAGLGLQPYYSEAYQLAAHVGQETVPAYELWAARARTPYSDCEACETCERALHSLDRGDDEQALATWEPVLAGQSSCREEPSRSIAYALLPLLRTGHADRARELHLTGYRTCRRDPSMPGEVGRHLEFCALTGNEARGLELLAENRTLFDEVDSPRDLLDFLTGVEVLLQRVESLGHGDLPAAGYAGRAWSVSTLRAEAARRADDLAARFDARNGTSAHTDRRRARLDRAPLLDALELTLRSRGLGDVAPAAAPAPRSVTDLPDALPELIVRARQLERQGNPDADACWARLRALVASPDYAHPDDPALGPVTRLRADLLTDQARTAHGKSRYDDAVALYEQAAALYDEAGEQGDAALARASSLLSAAERSVWGPDGSGTAGEPGEAGAAEGADDAPGARAEAAGTESDRASATRSDDGQAATAGAATTAPADAHAAVVRIQQETPDLMPYQEARLLRLRVTALGLLLHGPHSAPHLPQVLAEADLLHAFATRHGIDGQASAARFLRVRAHALCGDLTAAGVEADALIDAVRAHGPAWHLPQALGLRARVRLGLGDAQAAHTDLTEALRLAADWPADTVPAAGLHGHLAEASMRLGHPDEALRHLTRSAELEMRAGNRTQAFHTFREAAGLSLDSGRTEDAIALLDSLLAEPDAAAGKVNDRLLADLRLTRARALYAAHDVKAATVEFVALAAESAGWDDDPGSHAMIAAETAVLLAESGEFDQARKAAGRALAAHAREPRYEQVSSCLREVARLQAQRQGGDGLPAALALLADAGRVADEASAAGFEPGGRSLETALAYEYGRVNAYAGAYEDALAALEKALGLLGEPTSDDGRAAEWAECVRLAGVVEGLYLKRHDAARARLAAAAERLTAKGRTEEAEQLTALAARLDDEE